MEDKKQVACGQLPLDPPKLKTSKRNKYTIACSFLASLSPILLGYGKNSFFTRLIYILVIM